MKILSKLLIIIILYLIMMSFISSFNEKFIEEGVVSTGQEDIKIFGFLFVISIISILLIFIRSLFKF